MSTPEEYNEDRLDSGEITPFDLTKIVIMAQRMLGVRPDGFCGPVTIEALHNLPAPLPPPITLDITSDGWLTSALRMPSDPSWFGGLLKTPSCKPLGIVVHTSATQPGTAVNMAKRRQRPFGQPGDRMASWHISIEADGVVVQQVSLIRSAWHAGSSTAKKLDFGWANYTTVGIELISNTDKDFPPAQIEAAKHVWRGLVRAYGIPRERAMIPHATIDPARRKDPGSEWLTEHAPVVLDYALL